MPSFRRAIAVIAGGLACACGDGTAPRGTPGVHVVAGENATDTIGTEFTQALIVELRDDRGRPVSDHLLRFTPTRADESQPFSPYTAFIANVDQEGFGTFATDRTDADGRARVLVKLGNKAGPAKIIVTDPDRGIADTATYTVQPGNAVRVVLEPRDTALYVGRTATLREHAVDRAGNARSASLTRSVVGTAATLSGTTVTAASLGTALIVVTMGTVADTTFVSVPPEATIAAFTPSGLATFKTDGSEFRALVPGQVSGVTTAWSPSGTEIVFDQTFGPLQVVTLAGAVRQVASGARAIYPEYSRDGQWIFYSKEDVGWRLRRVRPDGANDGLVPMQIEEDNAACSPSPDGSKLVYTLVIGGGDDHLNVLDLATGATAGLNVIGHQPAWAPNGSLIAFVSFQSGDGAVKVMSPNGAGVRRVSVLGDHYNFGIDWSSDSQWIIAQNLTQNRLDLINPMSGQIIPLSFARSYNGPSLKP